MTVDYEAVRFWMSVVQFIGTIAIGVYVWWSNREKVTASRFQTLEEEVAKRAKSSDLEKTKKATADELGGLRETVRKHQEERCNQHLTRTGTLEEKIKATLTSKDLGAVYERINQVGGAVEKLSGTMAGINNNVNLLVEHHLKGGKS